MRALLLILVLANGLMFAWWQGWLERGPMAALVEQSPERIRVVPIERLGAPAATSVPPVASPEPAPTASVGVPASGTSSDRSEADAAPVDAQTERGGVCRAVSVASETAARSLAASLAQAGARVDTLAPSVPSSYLVYLPPAASREEAQRRVAALRQAGVDDVFLMQEGPLSLGISLGLFTREAGARDIAARVRGLGYEPLIAPRPQGSGAWRLLARWTSLGAAERGLQAAVDAGATVQECPDAPSAGAAAARDATTRKQVRD